MRCRKLATVTSICFLLVLFPMMAICQCPEWIGSTIEKAEQLKPLIQKHLSYRIVEVRDTLIQNVYRLKTYKDDKGIIELKVGWYDKDGPHGNTEAVLPPAINDLTIKGPAEQIDQLFAEMRVAVKMCPAYATSGQWVKFSNFIFIIDKAPDWDGKPMKFITIKPVTIKNDPVAPKS